MNSTSHFRNPNTRVFLAVSFLFFFGATCAFGDATVSTNTKLEADATYAGKVTVNSGVTLDLNGFNLGTTSTVVTDLLGTGTITNTNSTTKSTVTLNLAATNNGLAPTLTGNLDLVYTATSGVILRLRNTNNAWTGDTYVNGGRLHIDQGSCIGSGAIYLNGNLVNDNNSHVNLTLENPIFINGSTASIRAAYSGSMTLNGKISVAPDASNPKLTIGALETAANTYKLYGANDYSCGTWIGESSSNTLTQKIYIGTPTAFGTGPIQMVSNANLTLEKHGSTVANSLANTIHLGGKTLSITNSTGEAVTLSSTIDNQNASGSAAGSAGTLEITSNSTFNFTGSAGDGTVLSFKTQNTATISGSITGTAVLKMNNNGGVTYFRLPGGEQSRTGATYISGGPNTRVHVSDPKYLGTGAIYLDGNLCNNSGSTAASNPTFTQPIIINGPDASIRAAYSGSITLTGKISQNKDATNPKFTIGTNESDANKYYLYGASDYSCGTWIGVSSSNTLTHKIYIGTPTSFGTGPVYMVSNGNLTLEKTATSLANTIHTGGKTLSVTNSTGSAITISSTVDNQNSAGSAASSAGTLSFSSTQDITYSGKASGNVKLSLTSNGKVNFTGSATDLTELSLKGTGEVQISGSIAGTTTLKLASNGANVFYRVKSKNVSRTGDTYISGGDQCRAHISYGSGLGSGTIYLDGNLCNNSDTKMVTLTQPIVVNGSTASFRVAYHSDGASGALMKLTGVISSDPAKDSSYKLTFNANEGSPGYIFLYGENTFSCPSYFSSGNNTNKVVLGTDSALGTSTLTLNGSGTLFLESNTAETTRTLSNTIKIGNSKTLRFETVSTNWASADENSNYTLAAAKGDSVIESTITGGSGSQLIFGSATSAMNSGAITFSGTAGTSTTPLAVSVAAGQTLIGDGGTINGTLTMDLGSTLKITGGLKVSGKVTVKDLQFVLSEGTEGLKLLDVDGTLTLPSDAKIGATADFETPDPFYSAQLFSMENVVDESGKKYTSEELMAKLPKTIPTSAGWNYIPYYTANGIGFHADPNGLPEPATWGLLLAGVLGLAAVRRKK